jgi:methyl-accepting chemotaxis protein
MLRRKLILNLGPLVALLLATTVAAVLLLQGVLRELDHVNHDAQVLVESLQQQPSAAPVVESAQQTRHVVDRIDALTWHFRWVVMGLGLVFLLVINVSVIVLVRMATFILRPVDQLMRATRELAQEHFDHRVNLREHDEFDELASAYNRLAEHLQQTDKQRMEVLAQVGLALNHELNNAMGTMQLQLDLLSRRAGANPLIERRLRTIQDGMARMKGTVQSLKSARRIVLTDYAPGLKMLDLAQSLTDGHGKEQVSHA